MNEGVQMIFGVTGGLALFLFGMNNMSDALQKAAGEKMRSILSFLTRNPVMGALAGCLVTAVLQSSSATTVMAIGFVSAGLMDLPQAISVIFGANIGTTITAQLLAFKISDYIYPIIFIGFMIYFIFKNEKVKNVGMAIFSFGLLFEGIEIMGGVMKPLASSDFFISLMEKVSDIPVLGVLLGMMMTLLVQSSSATIAVLQNFASQPGPDGISSIIGLQGAIPILLGDNIGTTITALIASIGQSKDAKRTALAHSIFNISGSIIFLFLIPVLSAFVRFISPSGNEVDVISRQIANAHTTFNIVCTLIWLPLLPVMVKIVKTIIHGDDKPAVSLSEPKFLDEKVISQPVAAMYLVSKEIKRLSDCVVDMFTGLKNVISQDSKDKQHTAFIDAQNIVEELYGHIETYTVKLLSGGNLTEDQAEQTSGLLNFANHIELIADQCLLAETIYQRVLDKNQHFSDQAMNDLDNYIDSSYDLFCKALDAVRYGSNETIRSVHIGQVLLHRQQKTMSREHLTRIQNGTCDASLAADYTDLLYELDRIADNCAAIADEARNISFVHLRDHSKDTDVNKAG